MSEETTCDITRPRVMARPGRAITYPRDARPGVPASWSNSHPDGYSNYETGPLANATVAVWEAPLWSIHVMFTRSPGWCWRRIVLRSVGDVTVVPPTAVITSPAESPVLAAGDPG